MNSESKPALNILDVSYQETMKDFEMKSHYHNLFEIIYILEGKIRFKINNQFYTAGSNCILFISNFESHELTVIEYPYKRYFVLIKPDYLQSAISEPILTSIFKHRPAHFNPILTLKPDDTCRVNKIFRDIYDESSGRNTFWVTNMTSYLNLLLVFLYRNYKSSFPLTGINPAVKTVLDIQKYIEEHVTDEITLSEVAKLFYTDMYYISHQFKKVTGFNFKEYLILQRISKAKELLFHTPSNITQIGLDCGFNNVNHFIRIFRKYENTTPFQYRKALCEKIDQARI